MKLSKTILVAIATIVAFVYLIVANAAPAYLPSFPPLVFWGGIVAPLILTTIIISIWQNKAEKKQNSVLAPHKGKLASKKIKTTQHPQANSLQRQSSLLQSPKGTQDVDHIIPLNTSQQNTLEKYQPTVEHPALLCFALDVSDTMIDSVLDHTGKTVRRWASIQTVLDRFVYLGAALVKDPETRQVLPLYNLMAYGFGFSERAYHLGISKRPSGAVRDLLSHPTLSALPSAAEITDLWSEYKNYLISRKFTLDLLGDTPLCQALTVIRDRIKEECLHKDFILPVLLLILSDGKPTDGDPLPLISELHTMGVLTLCCYLDNQDVLMAKQLYEQESQRWTDGAKCMFRMASVLRKDSYLSRAMFDYLSETGWQPHEGVRLFTQINQTEALDSFLNVLLSGFMHERGV